MIVVLAKTQDDARRLIDKQRFREHIGKPTEVIDCAKRKSPFITYVYGGG
jgi:hypothetical protein